MESNGIRYESNSYPMIAFKHDINNICYSTISQRSSSSSLNDIIINGVIDGFYYMWVSVHYDINFHINYYDF